MDDVNHPPLIAEDLLLLLFDQGSRWFRGDGSFLAQVLAGATLAELALLGHLEIGGARPAARHRLRQIAGRRPSDPLLEAVWTRIGQTPSDLRARELDLGHPIRSVLVDRLVEAGHLRREYGPWPGLIPVPQLGNGRSERRSELITSVRTVLADGAAPPVRTGILVALLSAGGALPSLDPEVPWSSAVFLRGKAIQSGRWGEPFDDPVARAMAVVRAGQLSGAAHSPVVRAS